MLEVSQLREDVETRVGWLHSIADTRRSLAEGINPTRWSDHAKRLEHIAEHVDEAGAESGPALAGRVRLHVASLPSSDEARARLEADLDVMVRAIRRQTGQASADLGERWDAIHLLVVVALFFATTTLGLLVYVRTVALPRAERQVVKLRDELRARERLEAVGTLAAGVAHEINNPLTFVTTNLEVLREELTSARSQAGLLPIVDDALRGSERVVAIVRGLEQCRLPEGRIKPTADVRAAMDEALASVAGLEETCALRRSYDAMPKVLGQTSWLTEVFQQVVDNAVKAMARTEERDHVLNVTTEVEGAGWVRVTIADTGEGIPPELEERVREPFVTGRGEGDGPGLGLWVCQGVLDVVGGSLDLETSSTGTTVTIRLPPVAG